MADHPNYDFGFDIHNWNNGTKDFSFLNAAGQNNSGANNTGNPNNNPNTANNNSNLSSNNGTNTNNNTPYFTNQLANPNNLVSPMNLLSAPPSPADFMVQHYPNLMGDPNNPQNQAMMNQQRFNGSPQIIPSQQNDKNIPALKMMNKKQLKQSEMMNQQQQDFPNHMNMAYNTNGMTSQAGGVVPPNSMPPGFANQMMNQSPLMHPQGGPMPPRNMVGMNHMVPMGPGVVPPGAVPGSGPFVQPPIPPLAQQQNIQGNSSTKSKDDPPQPRTKVKPCDHCRRKKSKCVMIPETNTCKQCELKGLKCTVTDPLKRGLASVDESNKRTRFDDNIPPPPNIPIREVQPIKDYSSMQGHSLLKRTLSLQYPRSSFYIGPTSIYDPVLLERIKLDKIDQFQLNKTTSIRKVASDVQFTLRDDFTEDLYQKSERDVDVVERYAAPHGQALINLYFRTVHPSFPVLHKRVFLEKYSRTHREFGASLLAAVYCLAIQWWDYDPVLSQYAKPNVDALQKFAMKTFCDVIQRPKLSAVQAGLLLLQCRASHDRNWLLCSQVVAIAEELGLGLDCATWKLPKWERGLRRRLAWAVYVQDKWSSLIESRPSHIHEEKNWLVRRVTDEDFPEKNNESDNNREGSSDIENGKQLFKEMISLSEIVSEILDTFFTMSSMETVVTIEQVLKLAKPLQLKLREWYHSLPVNLQMNSLQPRKLNSNGYLQLAYFAAELTLHRRIISSLKYDTPPELVKVCRNAAKTRLTAAIEFAKGLKPEHIHSFWHSSGTANFTLIGTFAAILFVTSQTPEEENSYKNQLFDYRWILKINSKGFDQAADALEKLDNILSQIPGLLETSIVEEPDSVAQLETRSNSSTPLPNSANSPRVSAVGTPPATVNSDSASNNGSLSSPKLTPAGSFFQRNASGLREEIANSNNSNHSTSNAPSSKSSPVHHPTSSNVNSNNNGNNNNANSNAPKTNPGDDFPPMSITPETMFNSGSGSNSGPSGAQHEHNNSVTSIKSNNENQGNESPNSVKKESVGSPYSVKKE